MNKKLIAGIGLGTLFLPSLASATDVDITIENLTRGSYFTPLVVAAHPEGSALFRTGEAPSEALAAMAEGGSIALLENALSSLGATQSNNPAAGPLAPGATATTSLNTDDTSNTQLSIMGMILPSNDGFVAINSLTLPETAGTYTYYALAYDAGSEGNDEIRGSGAPGEAGMPVPPFLEDSLGNGGTGLANAAEGFVHVHRGVLGDTDANAGQSDIDASYHRWLNPVARITLVVQ